MRDALSQGEQLLLSAGVPEAKIDAEYCLSEATGVPRLLLRVTDALPTEDQLARYHALLARRQTREPLQYIFGTQPFMGFAFTVSPAALIPRFDTEILVQKALERLRPGSTVLDLCTGTGAIGIALKLLMPSLNVTLADISKEALSLAARNAESLGAQVEMVLGDLFSPLEGRMFDMIISNPPYIRTGELPCLQREVTFEPMLALDGGADGLSFYRRIAAQAPLHLSAGGWLFMEIGDGQREDVCHLLKDAFEDVSVYRDLNDLERAIAAKRRET